ncbi:MAG TPA: glycosyltransferase [Steroidobacteraceae bacterium]|nr:glycosyltransferase [Steroidobacteraceae bacterium]
MRIARLWTRGPPVALREWRRRSLRGAYLRGSKRPEATEESDPTIVATGKALREELIARNANKHSAAGYRVLMLRPGSITAEIWFGDLARCMRHAGIDCQLLPPTAQSAEISAAIESLQPNVLITIETNKILQTLDLEYLKRHKRAHGCLRHFIPVWHSESPRAHVPLARSTPAQDEERRRLRSKGLTVDAYFSIFEPEFHERFQHDPHGPAIEHETIPQGFNPFVDYPLAVERCYDYFMACSMSEERAQVAYRYLRPILRRHYGLWAGPEWGFGTHSIAPADMPLHYARTRIALSPLVAFVQIYGAEVTHRVYAAAACGAFQLTMPTPITERYFTPEELIQAATPEDYAQLFDYYLERPQERNAIALAALRRAYAEHSCFHRVDKLVSHWDNWRRRGLF